MDQIDILRRHASAAGVHPKLAAELRSIADAVERRAKADGAYAATLVEAARKRRGIKRSQVPQGGERHIPGYLPADVQRAVHKDVAALFHRHGEELFKSALEGMRHHFSSAFSQASEKLKAALREQWGAEGLAKHIPFMGDWRNAVLDNLAEYGAEEIRRMEQYGGMPATPPKEQEQFVPRPEHYADPADPGRQPRPEIPGTTPELPAGRL